MTKQECVTKILGLISYETKNPDYRMGLGIHMDNKSITNNAMAILDEYLLSAELCPVCKFYEHTNEQNCKSRPCKNYSTTPDDVNKWIDEGFTEPDLGGIK